MASTNYVDLVGPAVNAAWLNDVNEVAYSKTFPDGTVALSAAPGTTLDAEFVSYEQGSTGSVSRTVQNKLQQTVSVLDFIPTSVNPATTDVSTYINQAISVVNAAGGGTVVIPNGTYLVGANTVSGISVGVAGIVLLSNVNLVIQGTVQVINNCYGAGSFYGAIRSLDSGLSGASITGTGTINGNSSNQTASTQCSNIYLVCSFNVVVDGIYSVNANGMGIQLVPVTNLTHAACAVQNCFVNNCTNIGIQVSHGLFCTISGNRITTCTNNGIDIYGDNGTTAPNDGVISIANNTVGGALVGIFVETSSRTSVVGNSLDGNSATGIATNRINGAPFDIVVSGNTISNTPTGISDTGDTGGILISNNFIGSFSGYGLVLGGTAAASSGNISYVNAFGNVFTPSATTTPVIIVGGYQASFNIVRGNYCTDGSHVTADLVVNVATISTGNTLELPVLDTIVQPVRQVFVGTSTSGGTATITIPAGTAGKLVVKSSSGGSNYSIWSGSFVSTGSGAAVASDSSTFVAGQNNITSITASVSTQVLTINFAATGAAGNWNAWMDYF
jgi:hypothetical protein